jgi:hypothetical protein
MGGGVMTEETIPVSKFKATCLAVLTPPPQPMRSASWLGSFASSGKIVGDIVSPAQPEEAWMGNHGSDSKGAARREFKPRNLD